jgi:SRSO17 transposase
MISPHGFRSTAHQPGMRTHTPDLDPEVLGRLAAYAERFSADFARCDQARWVEVFLRGLLQDGDRKSVEPLINRIELPERCRVSDPVQAAQHWLNQGRWDESLLLKRFRKLFRESMDDDDAAILLDDTSFFKQGVHSVGVQHQYCGCLGKQANCQVAVSVHYATPKGHYPLAMRLWLPESWTSDPERLDKARVPAEHREPKSKHEVALELIDEMIAEGHRARTVIADGAYGSSTELRDGFETRNLRYAVGVNAETVAFTEEPSWERPGDPGVAPNRKNPRLPAGHVRPKSLIKIADSLNFRACRWREGKKGWLSAPFARMRVWPASRWQHGMCADAKPVWLLVERRGEEYRYYFSNGSPHMTLNQLVRLVKNRWPVEQGYQQLKEELGLDHFEGRSWPGFHHHVCMTILAFGFLELERQRLQGAAKGASKKKPRHLAHGALCQTCAAETIPTSPTGPLSTMRRSP